MDTSESEFKSLNNSLQQQDVASKILAEKGYEGSISDIGAIEDFVDTLVSALPSPRPSSVVKSRGTQHKGREERALNRKQ